LRPDAGASTGLGTAASGPRLSGMASSRSIASTPRLVCETARPEIDEAKRVRRDGAADPAGAAPISSFSMPQQEFCRFQRLRHAPFVIMTLPPSTAEVSGAERPNHRSVVVLGAAQ
jgi:hypothetical protein